VTKPLEPAIDSVIDAIDEDLADNESAASLLLREGPDHGLRLASVHGTTGPRESLNSGAIPV
jgi:hypothetical protein